MQPRRPPRERSRLVSNFLADPAQPALSLFRAVGSHWFDPAFLRTNIPSMRLAMPRILVVGDDKYVAFGLELNQSRGLRCNGMPYE